MSENNNNTPAPKPAPVKLHGVPRVIIEDATIWAGVKLGLGFIFAPVVMMILFTIVMAILTALGGGLAALGAAGGG